MQGWTYRHHWYNPAFLFSGATGDPGSVKIVLADVTVHYANFPHNELIKCLENWK